MAQYLTDLGERCTVAQHLSGQGMAELMRASMRCVDFGPLKCVANDRTHAVRSIQQTADWCHGSKEQVPVFTGWSAVLQIGGNGCTNIGGEWQQALPATLAVNAQLRLVPVDVVQSQSDDLAGA